MSSKEPQVRRTKSQKAFGKPATGMAMPENLSELQTNMQNGKMAGIFSKARGTGLVQNGHKLTLVCPRN